MVDTFECVIKKKRIFSNLYMFEVLERQEVYKNILLLNEIYKTIKMCK